VRLSRHAAAPIRRRNAMNRPFLALATLILLAFAVPAAAEDYPSYEGRGYGGPLYVGPDFNSNKPSYKPSKPVYREEPRRAPARKKTVKAAPADDEKREKVKAQAKDEVQEAAQPKSRDAADDGTQNENSGISRGAVAKADGAAEANAHSEAAEDNENSSITVHDATVHNATAAGHDAKPASEPKTSQTVGCKKYFPAAGVTLSVPCE
jgi:hypothetical protein